MNYFLLKLAFDTAVHFGGSDSAVGSQSSALTLRADTIFSALCHTALEVYGEPALEELLVSADADALRISNAMPWRGDSFYLPKPIAASTSPAELSTVERKAVKKLAWIPVSKFDRYTASLHSGAYPLGELDQSFGQAYEQTKASVTDGAAADDILDSIFRGVQVSDSAPIDNDKLILTGRTLISPLSAARVEDFDGDAKDLPLYQECVRPGETIRFRLTLDQSILNRYAHPITKDALLEAIAEFSRFYQDAFLSHFPQGHPVANIPDTPHLILGGGTGFLSKTVGYPYLKDDYAAALFKSRLRQTKKQTHKRVSAFFGASGDTELFEKASNINGFQGGRVANNLYISPFRATVFKTAALFLYLNSSVVIRVRKPLFFPL